MMSHHRRTVDEDVQNDDTQEKLTVRARNVVEVRRELRE